MNTLKTYVLYVSVHICMKSKSKKLFFIFGFLNKILFQKQLIIVFDNCYQKLFFDIFENVTKHAQSESSANDSILSHNYSQQGLTLLDIQDLDFNQRCHIPFKLPKDVDKTIFQGSTSMQAPSTSPRASLPFFILHLNEPHSCSCNIICILTRVSILNYLYEINLGLEEIN